MSKYLYTAKDIGIYFNSMDLPHSVENRILESLWEEKNNELDIKYRKNKIFFYKSVSREMEKYFFDSNDDEVDSINKILRDVGSNFNIDESSTETNFIEGFFRVIKLELEFSEDIKEVKMKLKTLLRYLGYKRRSEQLIICIKRTLKALGLATYLKGYEMCDVSVIKLDDMIMIRLI